MTATAPRLGSALPPANLPEAPVDELLTRFETDDREAVRSFLLTDPVLLFPLAASVPQIESVFGENVRIVLEPVVDPGDRRPPGVVRLDSGTGRHGV